jgi:pre-mRNA-splicing factor SYF1
MNGSTGWTSLDAQFEDELARNPYSFKNWWNYIQTKQDQPPLLRYTIYERALSFLPRSYKLWHAYLNDRTRSLKGKTIRNRKYELLIETYERALIYMNKMPRIWVEFCSLLAFLQRGTLTRKTFDRALQALPITQHRVIWERYVQWAREFGVPQTAVRVFRRYLMFEPGYREEYIDYLEEIGQYQEAAKQFAHCLNDERFVSPSGQTQHQLWMRLCDLCAKHPLEVADAVNVEALIRTGIAKFSDEVGRLWTSLADYYIRKGQFERARDVYEEALRSVLTVRDFTIIFDAYIKVEETIVTAKIRLLSEDESEDDPKQKMSESERHGEETEVTMRLARIEYLLEQRPLLVNAVVLRQNPHNVPEWQKRARLLQKLGQEQKVRLTYEEAARAIDPARALGRLHTLYLAWANLYEKHLSTGPNVPEALKIYERAIHVPYKTVEELSAVYCAYAECLMRHEQYNRALTLLRDATDPQIHSIERRRQQAVAEGQGRAAEDLMGSTVQDRVHKDTQLWALYLDLEESLGTVSSCRAAYDRAMELKVLTVSMALNYAAFLQENEYFEDSFQVLERSLALFDFPAAKPLFVRYIEAFTERYQGSKLERLRDLYEQALSRPSLKGEDLVEFFLRYAKCEEQFGLARHVTAIYDRAVQHTNITEPQRLDLYKLYVKKVEQHFGILKTRAVYDQALKLLPDEQARALCLDYAETEKRLGEIDRARAIYQYGAQFADPKRYVEYWQQWRDFESQHGSEETFTNLIKVQKSIALAFSGVSYLATDLLAATSASRVSGVTNAVPAIESMAAATNPMDRLAAQAQAHNDTIEDSSARGKKRSLEEEAHTDEREKKFLRVTNREEIDI